MIRFTEVILALIGGAVHYLFRSERPGTKLGAWLFTKKIVIIWVTCGIISFIVYFWIAFQGPRMRTQPHIVTFQKILPLPPDNAVPLESSSIWPISDTFILNEPENISVKNGKIYYGYYCSFCHGYPGQGIGPVGHSFVPTPKSLQNTNIQSLTDSAIIRIIADSPSHNPLLPYVISPEHRIAIARYVKSIK